jgi:hypothetical protein
MAEAYGVLRREGSLREHLELVAEFDDFTATVDLDRHYALEQRYTPR